MWCRMEERVVGGVMMDSTSASIVEMSGLEEGRGLKRDRRKKV